MKAQKFTRMLAAGSLPEYIKHQWASLKSTSQRKEQTTLVNTLFAKKGSQLVLNLKDPYFEQVKESFAKVEKQNVDKTLPKTLFMGKFRLDQEAFEAGLAAGDFAEARDFSGRAVFSWNSTSHSLTKGNATRPIYNLHGKQIL